MSVNPLRVVRGRSIENSKRASRRKGLKIISMIIALMVLISSIIIVTDRDPADTIPPVPSYDSALSGAETTLLGTRSLFNVWRNSSYLSDGLQEKMTGSVKEWTGQQYVYNAMNNLSLDNVDWETFNTSSWNHTVHYLLLFLWDLGL
jgi:hypothetical protein